MNLHQLQQGIIRRINRRRRFRIVTAVELASENSSCWQQVYPPWESNWPEDLPSGPIPARFRDRLSTKLPAKGVLRLSNASILGDHGWTFTSDGRCIACYA